MRKVPLENKSTGEKGFVEPTVAMINKGSPRWDRDYLFPDED